VGLNEGSIHVIEGQNSHEEKDQIDQQDMGSFNFGFRITIPLHNYSSAAGPEADPFFSIRPTYTGALVEKAVEYVS
jgi:hypothetical protein